MSAASLGRLSRSATRVVAQAANGFHLLRIDGYSQTKTFLPGHKLSSHGFNVGGHVWRMDYYPNGRAASAFANSNAVSVFLQLTITSRHDKKLRQVQARYKFSLLDHAGNPAYELPAEMGSFASVPDAGDDFPHLHDASATAGEEPGPGCGHEEFIAREELDRREHELIRDDSVVVRCDVGVTEVGKSWLALEELYSLDDGEEWEEEGYDYEPPAPPVRPRKPRVDDGEYTRWCVAQPPRGARR